ncbi:MAG: hypothetical protein J2P57_12960 [Acidimicrobiaceae bacterium]|nr:hypothetical protein [Acidimicrobiaceae bacterium]
MQEVRLLVELATAPSRLIRLAPGGPGAGVIPPGPRGLARLGNHRVEQDDHAHRHAHHGGGESAERLRDQHDVGTVANRLLDDARVFREAERRIVLGNVHTDRRVAPPLQFRRQQIPVRGVSARAGDQHERHDVSRIV